MDIAIQHEDIERRRRERAYRLTVFEIPALRVIGSAFLSLGVFISNRYFLGDTSLRPWAIVTTLLAVYCAASWVGLLLFYRRVEPRDLGFLFLLTDVVVWTIAIYYSGGEQSWLFIALLMRVADQTQTTFRRCLGFVLYGTAAYGAMLLWIIVIDHHPLSLSLAISKLIFVFFGGLYIALTSRTSERRRAQMASVIRMSRDLIRRLEEQSVDLREARTHAEEASAAKSDFLAHMSHEMRTPLHGILGMLQLLLEGEESPRRVRQLEMARRSAEALLGSIDDLLDFSKIEARRVELEPMYFSLRGVMVETMKPLGVTAAEKGVSLAYFVSSDVPDALWGDPLRLRQILINLVGNAVKFTRAGEIVVRVLRHVAAGKNVTLLFEVRDTGIGIDPSRKQTIFEPFTQGDSSHTRRYGGTGLGLAIVSRLVEAMNGSISVTSKIGKGTAFSFTVMMECDSIEAAPWRDPWMLQLDGKRVLVIEPSEVQRQFVVETLRAHGIAADGVASAVAAAHYACIVADESVWPPEGVPFVTVVSPLAVAGDERIVVTRPVGERELIEAIGVALRVIDRPVTYTLSTPVIEQKALRILVAEDNFVNQEFAVEALQRLGHIVAVAGDGETALELLLRDKFDLVLMDVQMPGRDGMDVTRNFRASEIDGSHTPIIALTAHTRREDRERCLEAGMDAVLTKPIDRRELAEVISTLVHMKAQADVDPILESVGGNVELLMRVRSAFARQTPMLLAAMHDAIARRDDDALYHSAHTMKGAASHFPGDASTIAHEVEAAARAKEFEKAAELMPKLEGALGDLERRISTLATQ